MNSILAIKGIALKKVYLKISMRFLILLLFILPTYKLAAQPGVLERIYSDAERHKTRKYSHDLRYEYKVLASRFSQDFIQALGLEDRRIYKIDLVYTEFSESPEFDQDELNLARLTKLINLNPDVAENDLISWNLVEQTGCSSSPECHDFFHGFVVYYNKLYTKEDTRAEIDSIQTSLQNLEMNIKKYDSLKEYFSTDLGCTLPEMIYSDDYVTDEFKKIYECDERFKGRLSFIADLDDKGRPLDIDVVERIYYSCNAPIERTLLRILRWKSGVIIDGDKFPVTVEGSISFPIRKGSITFDRFIIPDDLVSRFHIKQKKGNCTAVEIDSVFRKIIPLIDKNVVSKVLYRNKWESSLFVVDVTGSMYPYTTDLLQWLRLASLDEAKTFVFFNDGNDAPDNSKRIGSTGGIYPIHSFIYSDIKQQMFTAMSKGGGGDLAENNFEALLAGKGSLVTSDAVMIADNFSFPRDEILLEKYDGQLKIILCGTYLGINTEYIDLAAKHNFSLHTNRSDVYDLQLLRHGETITIDGISYIKTETGFKRVRSKT